MERRLLGLEASVANINRQVRNLRVQRLVLIVLLAGAMGFGFKAATQTESLQAEEIHAGRIEVQELAILRSKTSVRAVIQARADGRQGLEIRNSSNRVLFQLPAEE
jgi:hypothetical protein